MTSDQDANKTFAVPSLAILGGGPGGYEAAMVAASMGSQVTIVERAGLGGAAVLTDVVPSKTLIATAESMNRSVDSAELGISVDVVNGDLKTALRAELKLINEAGEEVRVPATDHAVNISFPVGALITVRDGQEVSAHGHRLEAPADHH